MTGRKVGFYYARNRSGEIDAPLSVIENRFPALFESRRILYPHFEELSDPTSFDQGIAGFLDQILRKNFAAFVAQAGAQTGHPVLEIERGGVDGRRRSLDGDLLETIDTLIVISFDSLRTQQQASAAEVDAVRSFLAIPGNLVFVCPHHEVGNAEGLSDIDRKKLQLAQFLQHGDRGIPPQQGFGGFARSLLSGLGVPVENRFGLHPAVGPDGSPAPIEIDAALDRLRLLAGVTSFNLHPHLPHLERLGDAVARMEVLARQFVDPTAAPHPFTQDGRSSFDALLQSKRGVFAGELLVGDATLWSSLAGGADSLRRLWTNIVRREFRS